MSMDLEMENEKLLQFVYACPVGLMEVAADGSIKMINPLAMQLLQPLSRTSTITNFFSIIEAYAPELRNLADGFTAIQGTICSNHRIFVCAGARENTDDARILSCTLVKLNNEHLMATLADVSGQVAQERRLKQAESWFASLLDGVDDFAVLSIDAEGRIEAVNPSVLRQTGFRAIETIGHSLDMFDAPSSAANTLSLKGQIEVASRDGWYLHEGWQRRFEGELFWCQRLIAARSEEGEQDPLSIKGYTVILREVTRQKGDVGDLKQRLTRDYLTGACNRTHFFELAERECSRSRRYGSPLTLIAIDVDHFKRLNDNYGHAAGDEVLKLFSQACMGSLRPSDTFARLGGEEFVVLLPGTVPQRAGEISERLRATIAATAMKIAGNVLHVTVSVGYSCINGGASTLTGLLAAADKALYAAKRSGRDCVMMSTTETVAACA
jgi:diguanylate cyclase (GGDEF)-like protein/PAS domain S-box-containing protein